MKTITRIAIALLLAIALAAPLAAQTSMSSTTLSAAVTATANRVIVASATGITARSAGAATTLLYVDQELMEVVSVSGTRITVIRGSVSTPVTSHNSGATVYHGPPGSFANSDPSGSCTSTLIGYTPRIVPSTGKSWECVDSNWVETGAVRQLNVTGRAQVSAASPSAASAILAVVGGAGGATTSTTGTGAAGAAASVTGGVGGLGGTSSGAAGTGGAVSMIAGAGGAGPVTGGTGGAFTAGGGAGGAGSGAGGTGGALNLYSGAAGSGGTGTVGALSIKSGGTSGTAVLATTTAGATTVASGGTNQNLTVTPSGTGVIVASRPISIPASTTSLASAVIATGTAPTTSVSGDIWHDSTRKTIAFAPVATAAVYAGGALSAMTTPVTATNPSSIADLGTFTLPAGILNAAGKTLKICGGGTYTTAAGQTPTVTITWALAGVAPLAIVSAATTASATTMPWQGCAVMTTITAGASGTVEAGGYLMLTLGTAAAADSALYQGTNTAVSSAFDQTATVAAKMRVTLSSADAGNAVTQRWMTVEVLN